MYNGSCIVKQPRLLHAVVTGVAATDVAAADDDVAEDDGASGDALHQKKV